MRRHPITRAGRLAHLLLAALIFPGNPALAQNDPAGAPSVTAPPPPEKSAGETLRDAAIKPEVPPPTTTAPPLAETGADEPPPPPDQIPDLPSDEPLPEPPAIPSSLSGGAPEDDSDPPDISQNVTINLLRLMVQKKLISNEEAELMVRQAQTEAKAARDQVRAAKQKEAAEEEESLHIPYIPESVRNQMRDEIKQQVVMEMHLHADSGGKNTIASPTLDESKDEGLFGDMRVRYEGIYMDAGNDDSGAFPNFHSINTGAPFDTAGNVFSPQFNVDQDRERYRLRFRIGGNYELEDGWAAGFRIATGENSSPVTTNQSLGLANQGAGGNFSKYAIWLERAFMRWDTEFKNGSALTMWAGRFDNPFFNTEIIFDEDVGFDGLAFKYKTKLNDKVKPFGTIGAFPVFNTDLNFSSNQPKKFDSTDKYLFAAQIGADFKLAKDLTARLAVGYYAFDGMEGELSTPYTPISASDAGDTDNTRPSFAQKGNTYRPLRQIIPDATNNFGTTNQWQYYGLATPHRPLTVSAKLDWDRFEPVRITVYGEYVKNTAFDEATLNTFAVNNRGPAAANGDPGAFQGDDTAWIMGVKFGKPALDKRGDWQGVFNYRWVGSDAVPDAFTDSEFGGGGTNSKGFTLGAQYALSKNAALGLSWLSSDSIAGPSFSADYLQFDLKLKF